MACLAHSTSLLIRQRQGSGFVTIPYFRSDLLVTKAGDKVWLGISYGTWRRVLVSGRRALEVPKSVRCSLTN